jgi:hypothetical protein
MWPFRKSDLTDRIKLAQAIAPIILANFPPGVKRTDAENARAVADGVGIMVDSILETLQKQVKRK